MSDAGPIIDRKPQERSFTLVETLIAVMMIAYILIEITGANGTAVSLNEYNRRILQASYLAKRIMAQVEYNASFRSPLKELPQEKERPFEDMPEYSYTLTMEPIPKFIDLMFSVVGGVGKSESDKTDQEKGNPLEMFKSVIQQSVGEDPLWVAKVEVFWSEGASRQSTQLAMILADTKKLTTTIEAFK
jgi:hypothetical protein